MISPEIAVVEAFEVPAMGWRFVDRRRMHPHDWKTSMSHWLRETTSLLERHGLKSTAICGNDPQRVDREELRFAAAQEENPRLTRLEFEQAGGQAESVYEYEMNPNMPSVSFGIHDRNGWIGALWCSNMNLERDDEIGIVASSVLALGVCNPGAMELPETWAAVIGFLLNATLRMEGGRSLDFVQYDFVSTQDLRERQASNPEIMKIRRLLAQMFDVYGDPNNSESASLFRRRGF